MEGARPADESVRKPPAGEVVSVPVLAVRGMSSQRRLWNWLLANKPGEALE